MAVTMAGRPGLVKPRVVQWVLVLACLFFWVTKFWLIPRLNINWDEFFFLSNVHAATRGELTQSLQTFYTRLFAWLPGMSGDEIDQIRVARVLMVALLGFSALLVQRLAARWFPPAAAWTAALAFLAMWPTLKHGGSFRADSLLLPLQLAALVVLTHPRHSDRNRGLGAGVLLGLATAISIKAVLLAPVVAVLGMEHLREWRRGLWRLVWLGAAALIS
jgi:4-amino-4-deoxy-L-arabinose transferase-like glycosyltransferase